MSDWVTLSPVNTMPISLALASSIVARSTSTGCDQVRPPSSDVAMYDLCGKAVKLTPSIPSFQSRQPMYSFFGLDGSAARVGTRHWLYPVRAGPPAGV